MEEMAGSAAEHGFTNCTAFDPLERLKKMNEADELSNIGIRIVDSISKDVQYQNLLGMNVLTIRI